MKTSKQAIAAHLGMDSADLTEYNYHPGRFTISVYAVGDNYYCASKTLKKAWAIRPNGMRFNWVDTNDTFCNSYGYKVFVHRPI